MKSETVYIMPFVEALMKELAGQRIVVRTADCENIVEIRKIVQKSGNLLETVILDTPDPVTSLPFEEAWRHDPLLIHTPELGRVSELLHHLPVIKGMSLRIMLPAGGAGNLTALRILSSLGIPSGLDFSGTVPDWDQVLDLATYFYYGRLHHAPIAPFDVFGDLYAPGQGAPFGSVYLDHPQVQYLHIDNQGQVAYSKKDLEQKEFLADSIDIIGDGEFCMKLVQRQERWRDVFLSPDKCAVCPGWKLCRGKLAEAYGEIPGGCSPFMAEMMTLIENFQVLRDQRSA